MAQKEATVYIVDVGASMGEKSQDRDVTDLDWSLQYIWDKITATVATDRKTAHLAVIGLRTDGSQNELDGEEAYHHITILKGLGQALMPDLRRLRDELKPSSTDSGDAISALVVAIQMITAHCKKLQYQRRIILVTNGRGPMDADDLGHIVGKLKEDNIELVILGVDFDDADYRFKEEDKDPMKAANETALQTLAEDCNGLYGTLAQAVEELSMPRIKTVKPVNSFKGILTLGDPENYDSAMSIDVERYPRVMVQRPPTASSYVIRSNMVPEGTQSLPQLADIPQDGMAAVKNSRTYQVLDENAPGGKKDVEQEELAKGYNYGSTAVPIAESDRNVTNFESKQGLDIVGFVAKEQYERYMDMTKTNVIVSQRTNDKASMALSSLIHALYELETYAVARLVPKPDKSPTLVILAPAIEPDLECLYEVELPFAEDIRSYRFPALDKIYTVSGKELKQHRNLPSNALMEAMSDYVDKMDLSDHNQNDDGEASEYMAIDDTFSPVLHRVNQVIRHRAIYQDSELPLIPDILMKYSKPPGDLVQQAQKPLEQILKAADLKKVPPKARSKRQHRRETHKPDSGLNVAELLELPDGLPGIPSRAKINPDNAIPEFKQAVEAAGSVEAIHGVCAQMCKIIEDYIEHSVGDTAYGRAAEAIASLRAETSDFEEPAVFNEFMVGLKKKLLDGELGGDRGEMWYKIRVNKMGLLRKNECVGGVDEEEAKEFLKAR